MRATFGPQRPAAGAYAHPRPDTGARHCRGWRLRSRCGPKGEPTREERAMGGLWQVLGGIFGVALLAIWGITVWDIVRSRLGAGKTAAWLLIVIIVPFIGALLYWVLRKPQDDEVQRQYDNEIAMRESRQHRPADSSYYGPCPGPGRAAVGQCRSALSRMTIPPIAPTAAALASATGTLEP